MRKVCVNTKVEHILEIAELTGKNHFDVLRAIRKMEPAWEKVQGSKFTCLQKIYNLPNGGTKMTPCYQLTKTVRLYIATKFNDEARAKLCCAGNSWRWLMKVPTHGFA